MLVVPVVRQPGARRERRGLLIQRRGGMQLAAFERELDEVFVVLEDIELEVVVAEDADAVDVAFREVLELRRLRRSSAAGNGSSRRPTTSSNGSAIT